MLKYISIICYITDCYLFITVLWLVTLMWCWIFYVVLEFFFTQKFKDLGSVLYNQFINHLIYFHFIWHENSGNSETNASELLKNPEEMFLFEHTIIINIYIPFFFEMTQRAVNNSTYSSKWASSDSMYRICRQTFKWLIVLPLFLLMRDKRSGESVTRNYHRIIWTSLRLSSTSHYSSAITWF